MSLIRLLAKTTVSTLTEHGMCYIRELLGLNGEFQWEQGGLWGG